MAKYGNGGGGGKRISGWNIDSENPSRKINK
jgi:hypothetical protein